LGSLSSANLSAKPLAETACPLWRRRRVYNRGFKGKLPEIGCRHTRLGMVCPGMAKFLLYFQPLGMVG
jgi:hypothetical protein